VRVIIGLGGNLGDPPAAFRRAIAGLGVVHRVEAVSHFYKTRPVGPPQPDYWNGAALIDASTDLLELLRLCHELEAAAGRHREGAEHWGPRPLDLDLLLAEGVVHRGPRLVLPHPELHRRAFALVPAAELAPAWIHPLIGKTLAELAEETGELGIN